jgi:hypothetical protein
MMYVKYPLSLRNVEDLLAERGIDISHETVRFWWNRFGPMFAAEIRKKRVAHMRRYPPGLCSFARIYRWKRLPVSGGKISFPKVLMPSSERSARWPRPLVCRSGLSWSLEL